MILYLLYLLQLGVEIVLIFNKFNGNIVAQIPNNQNYLTFLHHYPEDFKKNLDYIIYDELKEDIRFYKVENNLVVKRPKIDIDDILRYGRILTEEERLLELLKPSEEEIRKAENTIEILTLLQEVI